MKIWRLIYTKTEFAEITVCAKDTSLITKNSRFYDAQFIFMDSTVQFNKKEIKSDSRLYSVIELTFAKNFHGTFKENFRILGLIYSFTSYLSLL